MGSNVLPSPADERDYPLSAYLNEWGDTIPPDFEVWQPPTIEKQKAPNCVAQVCALIMECRRFQLYGKHEEYSVGYIYGTNLNPVNNGMFARMGAMSLVKEGDVLRATWECEDENPQCRDKRNALPAEIHAQADKYFEATVRLQTKEALQRYMLRYGLPALIVAPMSAYYPGEGQHATACYGWLSEETYEREYGNRDYKDLRYTNSWGEFKDKGIIDSNDLTEMWGFIPKENLDLNTQEQGGITMRGTEHLHPELQQVCDKFLNYCNFAGLKVKITDTLRTKAEQDELYAQGRTAPGKVVTNVKYPNSAHNWGVAFDICRNEKGREYDDSDNFFRKCGEIGESLGLTWGGRWKSLQDKPHFELTKFMPDSSTKWLRETYTDPERFMETWAEETEGNEVRYKYLKDIPNDYGFRDIIKTLMDRGIIKGMGDDGIGDVIDLSYDMLRMIVFLYRAGVFDGR